jgi:internalin A
MGNNMAAEINKAAQANPPVLKMDLRDKSIGEIPENIGLLTALTDLNLGRNQIKKLPPQVMYMKSLKVLNLANNKIVELPQEVTEITGLL